MLLIIEYAGISRRTGKQQSSILFERKCECFRFVAPNITYEFFAQPPDHPFIAIKGAGLVDVRLIVRCSAIVSTSLVLRSIFGCNYLYYKRIIPKKHCFKSNNLIIIGKAIKSSSRCTFLWKFFVQSYTYNCLNSIIVWFIRD